MTAKIDKPFKTYDELIDLLRKRNVIISDENFVKECLSNISYYTLINGYKNLYPFDSDDKFLNPVPFAEFFYLYNFDKQLTNLIFKEIISVERSIKSKLSYIISQNYGVITFLEDNKNTNPVDYLYRDNYRGIAQRNNILKKIKEKTLESKNLSVIHYRTSHNHIPAWILVNGISFALTIQWYEILQKTDKDYIVSNMIHDTRLTLEEKKEFFKKSVDILRKYRNSIAHGTKTFNNTINEALPKNQVLTLSNNQISQSDYRKGIGNNDLFAVIIILCTLLDEFSKKIFITQLINFFEAFNQQTFSTGKDLLGMLSLPSDFIEKLNKL